MINIKTHGRNGKVVGIVSVKDSDQLLIVSSSGKMIRMFVSGISVLGRNTGGVRLMKMDEGEKVVAMDKDIAEAEGNGKGDGGGKQPAKKEPPKPPLEPIIFA